MALDKQRMAVFTKFNLIVRIIDLGCGITQSSIYQVAVVNHACVAVQICHAAGIYPTHFETRVEELRIAVFLAGAWVRERVVHWVGLGWVGFSNDFISFI